MIRAAKASILPLALGWMLSSPAPAALAARAAGAEPVVVPIPTPAPEAPPPLLPTPFNLDFEQGELGQAPPGWTVTPESRRAGFGTDVSDQRPFQGRFCAVLRTIAFSATPATGTLIQRFDAAAWRGRWVRLRAAVRVAHGSQAQLFIRVERPGFPPVVVNMADRPVTGERWHLYQVATDVAADATAIGIGLLSTGDGQAFIDDAAVDSLGPAGAGTPPRPLDERAVANLVAFTHLLGYVRYFHPSDEAVAADWGAFAAAAIARLDPAPPTGQAATAADPPPHDAAELAAALQRLFSPLAPTIRVYPTVAPRPSIDLDAPAGAATSSLAVVRWSHAGLGGAARRSALFSSMVIRDPAESPAGAAPPPAAFAADLGGGASVAMATALYADAAGTLPHATPPPLPPPLSIDDRNGRLAIVALAWNVLQQFDPALALPPADRRWAAALPRALREAAQSGHEALPGILRRMLAATGDGQATLAAASEARLRDLPLHWAWVDREIVVTDPGPAGAAGAALGVHAGDTVVRINGRDARAALQAAGDEVAAATPQWRRWQALARLGLGPADEPLHLVLAPAPPGSAAPAGAASRSRASAAVHEVAVPHSVAMNQLPASGPVEEAVREARPGVLVVDLGRLSGPALEEAMPRLARATAIVFDLRGYVRSTDALLAHLIVTPLAVRREQVPHWTLPDRQGVTWAPTEVTVTPVAPHLTARLAFLSSARDAGVAEAFLATIAAYHVGPIVGSPTAGASGSVDSAPLPGGFTVIWTAVRPAAEAPPIGTAVAPTVPAEPTRSGLAAGRDEVLERALAQLAPAP